MKSKKENGGSLYNLDSLVPMDNEKNLLTTNANCTIMKLASTNQLCYFESYNFITAALQAIRVQSIFAIFLSLLLLAEVVCRQTVAPEFSIKVATISILNTIAGVWQIVVCQNVKDKLEKESSPSKSFVFVFYGFSGGICLQMIKLTMLLTSSKILVVIQVAITVTFTLLILKCYITTLISLVAEIYSENLWKEKEKDMCESV